MIPVFDELRQSDGVSHHDGNKLKRIYSKNEPLTEKRSDIYCHRAEILAADECALIVDVIFKDVHGAKMGHCKGKYKIRDYERE